MKIFEESTLDNKTLFYYFVIFISIIFVFSTVKIKLNIICGICIAYLTINYLYNNYREKQGKENKIKMFQESNLLPKPKIFEKYGDIIKYLFSIQDFYIYNPQAYGDMIKSLENFLRTYEETENNKSESGINYDLMLSYKKNATNSLHSIIYNLPNDVEYTNKLNDAIIFIQEILDKYLDKIKLINKNYIYINGYNNKTKIIDDNILPYNYSDNGIKSLFTFDLF